MSHISYEVQLALLVAAVRLLMHHTFIHSTAMTAGSRNKVQSHLLRNVLAKVFSTPIQKQILEGRLSVLTIPKENGFCLNGER